MNCFQTHIKRKSEIIFAYTVSLQTRKISSHSHFEIHTKFSHSHKMRSHSHKMFLRSHCFCIHLNYSYLIKMFVRTIVFSHSHKIHIHTNCSRIHIKFTHDLHAILRNQYKIFSPARKMRLCILI